MLNIKTDTYRQADLRFEDDRTRAGEQEQHSLWDGLLPSEFDKRPACVKSVDKNRRHRQNSLFGNIVCSIATEVESSCNMLRLDSSIRHYQFLSLSHNYKKMSGI